MSGDGARCRRSGAVGLGLALAVDSIPTRRDAVAVGLPGQEPVVVRAPGARFLRALQAGGLATALAVVDWTSEPQAALCLTAVLSLTVSMRRRRPALTAQLVASAPLRGLTGPGLSVHPLPGDC